MESPSIPINQDNNLVNSAVASTIEVNPSTLKTPKTDSLVSPVTQLNQDNNLVDSAKLPDQPERPESLPPGWLMETKIRDKGKSIGHKDK
ncbi:hypothetical protein FRX31_017767, partial [Thalictrum thalictroides]